MSGAAEKAIELAGVAEVIKEANLGGSAAAWVSCSGCHETNEGAETGFYPYSESLGCYLGSGCSECGGIGAVWEYWTEAELEAMAVEATKPVISAWLPERDRHRLAVLGKLSEECNELGARAARCIIHGLDETDPASGRLNREEMEREIADVIACIDQAAKRLGVRALPTRVWEKFAGFDDWHDLIDQAGTD